ncbi:uncharacterized protein BDV17DRAFT_261305 [Aspergillus undulatus]|uniref:uncharacterized protein n=1 Tax=Aspergillus undulatus TaxID=1810928 RepID=UPI003CCCB797
MRMSRATTLLHLILGLRTSTSATLASPSPSIALSHLTKSPASTLFAQCAATNLYSAYPLLHLKSSPLARTYSTMSSPSHPETPNPTPNQILDQQQEPSSSEEKKSILALPDASTASDTTQLDVNGDGVKLDHLGPLIVNNDGTLARIGNWAQMTEMERKNTLRIIGKRNKERMARLKEEQAVAGVVAEGEKKQE